MIEIESLGPVPASSDVTFLCPKTAQSFEGGLCTGLLPTAFKMHDDGISVTWIEFFEPPPPSLEQAASAIKNDLKPKKSGVLACATVSRLTEIAFKLGLEAAVTHDPQKSNHGHSLITGWPDNLACRVALTRAFVKLVPNTDVLGFV